MGKFKRTVFITCLIFSLAEFCLGDDLEDVKKNVTNLEKSDKLKDKRIAELGERIKELTTAVQNSENLDKEVQKNLNESVDTIAELQITVQNIILQKWGYMFY